MCAAFDPIAAVRDESLRTATLLGLASIPFTIVLSWEVFFRSWGIGPAEGAYLGGTISGGPILAAGLVAGYRYSQRPTSSRSAGIRVGIVGSVPILFSHFSNSAALVLNGSLEIAVLATLLTPLVIIVGAGICGLVGMVAAILGDRLADKVGRDRAHDAGN
ncbi:DUF5518 domain-containing protein [Halorussus litoreus]|uniref:DUF5518 domain-containing protein n=1 Tax=Halorussus litoreus TaxID=1710536 RepID=UPI000E22CC07|nr:DUF5518 domain-containing protein [Halorussus litoreus]